MENSLEKYLEMVFSGLEGYVYSPIKRPENWEQKYFEYPKEEGLLRDWIRVNSHDATADVYISPVLYSRPHAVKANFKVSQVVWVEWDGERFLDFTNLPEPTGIVQTSSDTHCHCYWNVDPINGETVEDVNRRLTFFLGADSSGWDCTQLLRPPETFNRKRSKPVILTSYEPVKHDLPSFDRAPKIETPVVAAIEEAALLPLREVLAKKTISSTLTRQLKVETAVEPNRSSFLASVANNLAEQNFTHLEIVSCLWEVDKRVKKFTGRSDQLLRLNQLADYALHKHLADEQITVYTPEQIIEFNEDLEWILTGLLHSTGQMIISSAPGVGKTQLTLQLSYMLSTGESFLGLTGTMSTTHTILVMSLEMDVRSLRYILAKQKNEWKNATKNIYIFDETSTLDKYEALVKKYQPTVVVIDSLTELLDSSDDPAVEAVKVMRWCKRIRMQYNCAIILIHHNRKATEGNKKPKSLSDLAGSFHFGRVTDTVIQLWQDHKGLELSTVKSRFGPQLEFILLRNHNLWYTRKDAIPDVSNRTESVQSDQTGDGKFQLVSVDTETNWTNRLPERYLLGLAITTDLSTYYIPVGHQSFLGSEPNNLEVPKDIFTGVNCPIVAHNMKFDYVTLKRQGIELPVGNLWCTMMMAVYIDETNKGKDAGHDLDTVLRKYMGEQKRKVEKNALLQFGWSQAPPEYMAQYAEQDCRPLPELYKILRPKLSDSIVKLWQEVDRDFMLLLGELENLGIPIDRQLCEVLNQKCLLRMNQIREELGFDPAKPSQLHPKLFHEPPFGLGLKPASKTPLGKPNVSLDWLQSVGHPMTSLVYEYRRTAKQQSSYFSAYLNLTTRDDPRLHCHFKQHGTETGRLSCELPNLQQIPREEYKDAEVKKLFMAEEGKQLWEVDFRTIEYRLQAVYAQDRKLISLFENEGDFHQFVADDLSEKLGVKFPRQQAKTVNYLMSYGGGKQVLAKALHTSVSTAQQSIPLIELHIL